MQIRDGKKFGSGMKKFGSGIRDGKNSDPVSGMEKIRIRDNIPVLQHQPVATPQAPLLHLSAEDGEATTRPLLLADVEADLLLVLLWSRLTGRGSVVSSLLVATSGDGRLVASPHVKTCDKRFTEKYSVLYV
jgi:hypothetical protein